MTSNRAALPELLLVGAGLEDELMWFKAILNSRIPCRFTVRREGREALEYLLDPNRPLPAMLVLDNRLPKLDCMDVVTQLRLNDRTRSMPVVIFNGVEADDEVAERDWVGSCTCLAMARDRRQHVDRLARITRYWLTADQESEKGSLS